MILITGATGFVGKPLCVRLSAVGPIRALARTAYTTSTEFGRGPHKQWLEIDDLCTVSNWRPLLDGIEAVVHLAARTHVLRDSSSDPLTAYRRINVQATETLARAGVKAGVKRFIFLSSIKVNGERSLGQPFHESAEPRPVDAYGVSKWEAEQVLSRIAAETGLEVVIVRPPLVYGPGVKGNFLRLLEIARRGWPLPLASVRNLRSYVYVENLVDALVTCATHPKAAGKTYLVGDNSDLSTPELIGQLSSRSGARARLLPFPPGILLGAAKLAGRGGEASRLLGSLQVDSSLIRAELGWTPPFNVSEGLDRTVHWH